MKSGSFYPLALLQPVDGVFSVGHNPAMCISSKEQGSFSFMAAITIQGDFGAQENKRSETMSQAV